MFVCVCVAVFLVVVGGDDVCLFAFVLIHFLL